MPGDTDEIGAAIAPAKAASATPEAKTKANSSGILTPR